MIKCNAVLEIGSAGQTGTYGGIEPQRHHEKKADDKDRYKQGHASVIIDNFKHTLNFCGHDISCSMVQLSTLYTPFTVYPFPSAS
jgi:hypothetical protein